MVSRDKIEGYLEELKFPIKKEDVVAVLRSQPDLDPVTNRLLPRLPDITYRKPADVAHGLDFARTKAPLTRPRSMAGMGHLGGIAHTEEQVQTGTESAGQDEAT
ncbi:MAG TPA: DUF2795 domain-containing protein [Candidatus Thermoplasmatota archaeon]|nr:DUF2795 domain-containing protein [Candidatus Thermoplasmatota archaeon]